jgi:hypothetical protein
MSAKTRFAALAALMTVLSVHGTALAQSNGNLSVASDHRLNEAIHNLRTKVPSDAFGSVNARAATLSGRSSDDSGRSSDIYYNSQFVGRDPDSNVRSQILRDR